MSFNINASLILTSCGLGGFVLGVANVLYVLCGGYAKVTPCVPLVSKKWIRNWLILCCVCYFLIIIGYTLKSPLTQAQECPNCDTIVTSNYCPDCGVKMDLEDWP